MSIVEAVRLGCRPLLPGRLAYPELIPAEHHAACLYEDPDDLAERLAAILSRAREPAGPGGEQLRRELSESMARFSWERVVGEFDAELDRVAAGDAP